MKKYLLITLLSWFCFSIIMAQDSDPWVGTWTSESYTDMDWENSPKNSEGTYLQIINTQYKLVIRITKTNDKYNVRIKKIRADNPNSADYANPHIVTRIDGNTIYLESYKNKMPLTVNGVVDSYSDVTQYTKLELINGGLHYHYYKWTSRDYDRNMRFMKNDSGDTYGPGNDLMLYNDDW